MPAPTPTPRCTGCSPGRCFPERPRRPRRPPGPTNRPEVLLAMADDLRVGFVTGTTPDKWARAWRDQRRGPLSLVPIDEGEQEAVVRRGEVDMALVRLPLDTTDLHCVRLYDELPVVVAGLDHVVSVADDVTVADLVDEQLVRPARSGWRPTADQRAWPAMSEREAIEAVAAGSGVVIVPMSVAQLYH